MPDCAGASNPVKIMMMIPGNNSMSRSADRARGGGYRIFARCPVRLSRIHDSRGLLDTAPSSGEGSGHETFWQLSGRKQVRYTHSQSERHGSANHELRRNFGFLKVPDRDGKIGDVVLGCPNLEGYRKHTYYFGAIIGRYGNRIAGGKFTLDGKQYTLPVNNGPNSLHGGLKGSTREYGTRCRLTRPAGRA